MGLFSEAIAQHVKEGNITAEFGKAVSHKLDISDRIMKIYKNIAKSANSRLTTETLALENIEIIP